jgi:Cu-Zn family superoxide dismutase
MMKILRGAVLVLALVLVGARLVKEWRAPADEGVVPVAMAPQRARAELKDREGKTVGTAVLTEEARGVRIEIQAMNLPAGRHGFHIHDAGRCEPPQFTSAGGHFNPGALKHGMENPAGPHGGDLPNLVIGQGGTGSLTVLNPYITLADGDSGASLFHPGGTALVIHAGPDDYFTDPAGNSGERIACGVITKG